MKKIKLCALAMLLALGQKAMAQLDMKTYIDNLMAKMTVEEKLGQLNQLTGDDINTGAPSQTRIGKELIAGRVGSVLNVQGVDKIRALQKVAVEESRLGIPLIVGLDVIHGYETLFPIPLGLSCTWDLKAIEQSAHVAATEAGANGIAWTFSPMVDINIDSRWGRAAEGNGEDPYLGSRIAEAMIRGYQGPTWGETDNLPNDRIMACVKHFALYGAAESGRDYNTVDMSRLRMYNQYFAPYKAAVQAGAGSVMTSFNIVDYVPASANKWLMTDVLRQQWGFDGFVVTDYATITEMQQGGWGIGDVKSISARCLKAGVDMDMVAQGFIGTLGKSLEEGKVTMAEIDLACRRVLEAKWKLGLFADPYKYCDSERAKRLTYSSEHRNIARKTTAESFVLLRNEAGILPLSKNKTVALIGPMADNKEDIAGTWSFSAKPEKYKSVYQAMKEYMETAGQGKVLCTQGCNLLDDPAIQKTVSEGHGIKPVPWVDEAKANAEALNIAKKADVIVCAMGECAWMSGEGTSRADLTMPAPQRRLLEKLAKLGKPIVLLNFSGRATVLKWESEHIPAIMNVWFGSECGDALCDVLFGDVSPSGRLTVSMPQSTGQLPLYYNQLQTGRPVPDDAPFRVFASNYIDQPNGPLYPFGYGLTYTTFEYGKVTLSKDEMRVNDQTSKRLNDQPTNLTTSPITATVEVKNTGNREASEVVQLYIRDMEASISRPLMELKGFERITLKPGESRKVSFTITPELLKFYNSDLEYVLEPGEFAIMTGPDCKHVSQALLKVSEQATNPLNVQTTKRLNDQTTNRPTARPVYDEQVDPMKQIDAALAKAKKEKKQVICQVGGNWCRWCLMFADFIEQDADIAKAIADHYVYIHVNYPRRGASEALLKRLGDPGRFGYPALVVLGSNGTVRHIQDSSYLEEGEGYNKEKVLRFLNNWK